MRPSVVAAIAVGFLAVLYCMELKEIEIKEWIEIGLDSMKKRINEMKDIHKEIFLYFVISLANFLITEGVLAVRRIIR
ncbi:Protein CBG25757 [Caenorhabditis briggsae]|uniref:Uncharacterized protein n=2 Tax=Caenorhabditis briggsae TaxID=6238 RepID=A0AAE8ZXL5_CAEBR|nr:Protein CBG25757 [Caenorhabditis briggsae]ULT85172.1 hypothetical protein L3Y34_013717 [Caenorhabditis briggsae]CAR99458.1 Protein CBG25757 [Caenorhabditis briggsae]